MDLSKEDNQNLLMSSDSLQDNDLGQSSDQSKDQKGKKKYSVIPQEVREKFIQRVISRQVTIKEAAQQFGIKFSTSQAILQTYKKEGRIGKKQTRQRKPRMTSRQPNSIDNDANYTPPIFSASNENGKNMREEQTQQNLSEIHSIMANTLHNTNNDLMMPDVTSNVAINYYQNLNFHNQNEQNPFEIIQNQYPNPFDSLANVSDGMNGVSIGINSNSNININQSGNQMNLLKDNDEQNKENQQQPPNYSESIIQLEYLNNNSFRDVSHKPVLDTASLQDQLNQLTVDQLQDLIESYNQNYSNRNLFPQYNYSNYFP